MCCQAIELGNVEEMLQKITLSCQRTSLAGFDKQVSCRIGEPLRQRTKSPTALKELTLTKNNVSLEADPSPVEPSDETPALAADTQMLACDRP